MHQVFLNLCINARDAMPHGGVLTLSGENVVLDTTVAGLPTESRSTHPILPAGHDELVRQLRSRNPDLKVIAISGLMDRTASGASQMDIFADGFLHKPFSSEELVLLMASVLKDRR